MAEKTASNYGTFIVFEGGDGAGKTTQIAMLDQRLRVGGSDVVLTREPGGTDLGLKLRELLLHGNYVAPRAEALIFAADRAHHVETKIRPALEAGQVVLCDRYIDSSIAYQSAGRNLAASEIEYLSRWGTDSLTPAMTIVLDIDPVAGKTRRLGRAPDDRFEAAAMEFHQAVRGSFLSQAAKAPHRYAVINAENDVEQIAAQVWDVVAKVLAP